MLVDVIEWPPAGRYVVAVSGGADSVALLRLMAGAARERGYDLVIAHFDHRMRAGSATDADFVAGLAQGLGLRFEVGRADAVMASEAAARAARYAWLRSIKAETRARAILTAHHQDDLVETSLLNLARGSGWRGIAPFRAPDVARPLTGVTRAELRAYLAGLGQDHVEDPTNFDLANPRNLLRHRLLAQAGDDWRRRYVAIVDETARQGAAFDAAARDWWREADGAGGRTLQIPVAALRALAPETVAALIAQAANRLRPGIQLRRRTVQEAALFAVTAGNGQSRSLHAGLTVSIKALMVRVSFGF